MYQLNVWLLWLGRWGCGEVEDLGLPHPPRRAGTQPLKMFHSSFMPLCE